MAGSIHEHRASRFARFFAKERMDVFSLDLYRACAAEFLGVLLLAFCAVGTAVSNPGDAFGIFKLLTLPFIMNILQIHLK
jgi:hypothetical protein